MNRQVSTPDNQAATVVSRLCDARRLAQMFQPARCERTIRYWQAHRVIPYYKVGRAVLFDPQEVFSHLAKHNRVEAAG
jgi:hypothetical protein